MSSGRCNRAARHNELEDRCVLDELEARLRPLWLQAQAGNEAAYRHCLLLMAERLRSYFGRRMAGMDHDVEDLVQDTLLALHLQRGTYDEKLPVSAWLHAIARHKLVDLWRRRGRSERLFDSFDDLPEDLHPMTSPADATDTRHDLSVLLQALPAAQRQAIVATRLEGLSVADAAARSGSSESAIKVQVHRGLKRLATLLRGISS
ncbi:MAG: sigma-70 family RNA polymerase sigma factor [Burkholderiales bacterium]|nr:sigma-70 family RNA polymerase sigma factor [Burkholderiales bacterium]